MATGKTDNTLKSGYSGCKAKDRLLDIAEKMFSENGFDATSVRDLTTAANCNIAAVNYHFGGKEGLYKEMFRRHLTIVFGQHRKRIDKVMNSPEPTLEKLLRAVTTTSLEKLTAGDQRIPVLKLLVRECLNSQLKEEVIATDIVKGFLEQIGKYLMQLVPQLDEKKAMMCVFSLEGLLMHPMLFYDFYSKLFFDIPTDELIEHIVIVAAAGIRKKATLTE